MQTIEINNLGGPLTRRNNGNINSGLARFSTSWGYDPYSKPGNLTWMEQPVSILTLTTLNGPVVAMKTRTESTINYVYNISGGGGNVNLRRFQVGSGTNINYDSPSLLAAVTATLDVTQSAGMAFYGSPQKIFLGMDTGIAKVNFNGSSPSVIANTSSNAGAMVEFLGRLYFSNGNNIGEIDSTETITTTAKLSPALPISTFINDLDVSEDGNYLEITASELQNINRLDGTISPVGSSNNATSYKYYWNGVDSGITSFKKVGGLSLISNQSFGNKTYSFGYDFGGAGVFDGSNKVFSLSRNFPPQAGATFSVGNVLGFANPEYDTSTSQFATSIYNFGKYDEETPGGLFRLLRHPAQVRNDVVSVPACLNTANLLYVPSIYGYTSNIGVAPKLYYSTVEEDNGTTNRLHKLWRMTTVPTGSGSIVAGVYETQTQLFTKKVKVGQVRVYTEPLVGGNDFVVDLIGSGGSVMTGGSQRFLVGTSSVATGTDMVSYTPLMAPTYAVGVRITNSSTTGVVNWTARKLEIDYQPAGI